MDEWSEGTMNIDVTRDGQYLILEGGMDFNVFVYVNCNYEGNGLMYFNKTSKQCELCDSALNMFITNSTTC